MKKFKSTIELLTWIQDDLIKVVRPIDWANKCAQINAEHIEADMLHPLLKVDEGEMLVSQKQMLLGALLWAAAACAVGVLHCLQYCYSVWQAPARTYEELEREPVLKEEEGE